MKSCKVIGCNNRIMEIKEKSKDNTMKGNYGYCQIHNIEGLVKEESMKTIKELQKTPNTNMMLEDGYLMALRDVVKLIDKNLKNSVLLSVERRILEKLKQVIKGR